ncbi:ester cyclase [Halegenticoccus soli]|uniref:ester cyclase n=1 Tax=Halegenticoccus soli TaxID=1985678 RepID=UPI000C6CEED7|nr:ester cyclase [Halegenticoccus soli]
MLLWSVDDPLPSTEADPKEVARQYVEVVWNRGDIDALDGILTAHQLYHDPTGDAEEPLLEFKDFIQGYRQAFPDLHLKVDRYIAEGDSVAFWGRTTGTHEGSFMGLDPTGKTIDIMGINVVRVEDGKIAERWANFDLFGLLQQLGANPLSDRD